MFQPAATSRQPKLHSMKINFVSFFSLYILFTLIKLHQWFLSLKFYNSTNFYGHIIWPNGQVQQRHVRYLLDKTFFCNSCLSNEANAHSPPYTAILLVEIICNVKTGKEKKKERLLVLKILFAYTYSVQHI